MKKNEGSFDRIVRTVFAVVFFSLGMWFTSGILSVVMFVLVLVMVVTAATGICPMYPVFGMTTLPKDRAE